MSDLQDALDRFDADHDFQPEHWKLIVEAARRVANGMPTPFCETHKRTVPPPTLTEHGGHHSPTEGCHIVQAVIAIGVTEDADG